MPRKSLGWKYRIYLNLTLNTKPLESRTWRPSKKAFFSRNYFRLNCLKYTTPLDGLQPFFKIFATFKKSLDIGHFCLYLYCQFKGENKNKIDTL